MKYNSDTYANDFAYSCEADTTGSYYILIITSGNLLKWPMSWHSPPPKYKSIESAKNVIKKYVKFANTNSRTKIERVEAEFEVIQVKDYKEN